MAIPTTWPVTHSCGHDQDHDLSAKKAADRAGFARWLATKECSDCWRAAQHDGKDKETWLAERRAEEAAIFSQWEQKAEMPRLDGSEKAVEWGRRVRYQLMSSAYEYALESGLDESEFIDAVETPARLVTRASWWIDQRAIDPADVPELIESATSDPTVDTGCENPD